MKKAKTDRAVEEQTVHLVTFQVGGEEYGMDIHSVTEVVRPLKITPLPGMPEFIEGVVNLRGAIIPIVDLRKRFALSRIAENPRKMRMLITKGALTGSSGAGRELLGVMVDGVNEVLYLRTQEIEPAPEAARGLHVEFITGMGKIGDRLVTLIDIAKILNLQERTALAEAAHAR